MPNLQLHQLRVAAVAKLICENFEQPIDERSVILACLFHDMGNIIKSDLGQFPEFRAGKGRDHWESVKARFVETYGDNAHQVNVAIAKEIGLPERAVSYIDGISFSNLKKIARADSYEQKICEYADTRVGPYGTLSLQARLAEARTRYVESGKSYYTLEGFADLSRDAEEIERQLFRKTRIKPEDITDESIARFVDELQNYSVA